jgi:hypothetical protein
VRQEAIMEFRNVDTVRLGGGKIVAGQSSEDMVMVSVTYR